MDPERFQRIMGLFQEANQVSQAEVGALLDRRCGEDAQLRAEVVALLEHATGHGGLINTGAGMMRLAQEVCPEEEVAQGFGGGLRKHLPHGDAEVPVLAGQYRILRVLGEGGMGTVYEAEQLSPRRLVALKAIRHGFASRQMLRRFQQEAHILGRLQHPGIAQIYDAGAADGSGSDEAYFVMELVRGRLLTDHAADLSVRDRLELMADVCDAVHHAHQRGVIHRDLKPGNILVDPTGGRGRGQPKILDFGVARTADAGEDGATLHTAAGQIVGTLSYMSPEQIAAHPDQVDVRSDVYSLGVLLYQVLAGHLPLNLRDKLIHEAARIVCEEVPPLLGSIDREFRGEIETIVARAIEKDKSRRYQSAAELGDDLRRYLAGDPIEAKRDSALYVIRKQVSRHRAAVAGGLAAILGICFFAIYAAAEARHSRELAGRERAAKEEAQQALGEVRVAQARADREAAALRESLYASRISVAQAAFLGSDAEHMQRALAECPPEQRGWEWRYLSLQADQSIRSVECFPPGASHMTHRRAASIAAPDTAHAPERLYATRLDGFVVVLDAASGDVIHKFHTDKGENIIVHDDDPRGDALAIGAGDGTIIIHALPDGGITTSWKAHENAIQIIEYSRDGAILLTGTLEGSLRLWDVASRTRRLDLDIRGEYLISAERSPDEETIVTSGTSGTIRSWNAHTGAPIREFKGHDGTVIDVAFSADGRYLASAGEDRSMRVWEWETGRLVSISRAHTNKVTAVALNADGSLAASGGTDSTVRVTETATGREVRRMLGHGATITGITFADDASKIMTCSRDGTVRWWRAAGEPESPPGMPPLSTFHDLVFSPDGATIAVAGTAPTIILYDALTRSIVKTIATGHDDESIYALAYSKDGSKLYAAGKSGPIVAWDPKTGLEIERREGHVGDVVALAVSPVTGQLASVGADRAVRLWPTNPSEPARRLEGHTGYVPSVVWFPDGSRLASGSYDGTVRIWNAETGACERTLPIGDGGETEVHSLIFADQNRVLVCGTENGCAQVVDTSEWKIVGTLRGHKGAILCMGINPDGTRLATGGFDNTVRVWDTRARAELLTLPAHSYQVLASRFSPDGLQLVSTGADGKVKFWVAAPK